MSVASFQGEMENMVRVSCLMSMGDAEASGRTGLKASVGDPGGSSQGQHSRRVGRGVQQASLEVEGVLHTLETGSKGGQGADSLICTFIFTPRHPQVSLPLPSPQRKIYLELSQYSKRNFGQRGSSSAHGP